MDFADVLKWLPQGGAAGAVIVVVWMFLNQQDKMSVMIQALSKQSVDLVKDVSTQFTNALKEHREKTDERLEKLATNHAETTAKVQGQVNDLVRENIVSNTQMTEAIKELRVAVGELQKKD